MSFEQAPGAMESVKYVEQDVLSSRSKRTTVKKRRSIKSCVFSDSGGSPSTRIDPFFIYWPMEMAGGKKTRNYFRKWQVICADNQQLFLIGRTASGCDFSTPLIGLSYDSMSAIDDEGELYFLLDQPKLRDDLEDWQFYCALSGVDAANSIDVTPQVWQLHLALNGKLKRAGVRARASLA